MDLNGDEKMDGSKRHMGNQRTKWWISSFAVGAVLTAMLAVTMVCGQRLTLPRPAPGRPTTSQEIPNVEKPKTFDDCVKLMEQGFWKETFEGVESLIFDDDRPVLSDASPLSMAVMSLGQLNRADEADAFLDRVLERYSDDWRGRTAVVTQRLLLPAQVCRVGEKIYRGKWVDGGEWLDASTRERVEALKVLYATIPLVEKDNSPERAMFYRTLAATLRWGTPAWKLQVATDIDGELPDYDQPGNSMYAGIGFPRRGMAVTLYSGGRMYGDSGRGAPVDENGEPVYYTVPRLLEDAKNDGERWRWCLEQTAEVDASQLGAVQIEWASFLASQFGVQTLGWENYGRGDTAPAQQNRSAKFQLETLTDAETIAKLANGVRRFELPEEYNYISVLRGVAEAGEKAATRATDDASWASAMLMIGRELENRRQYERAAEWYDRLLEAAKTPDGKSPAAENAGTGMGGYASSPLGNAVSQANGRRQEIRGQRAVLEIPSDGKQAAYLGTGPDGNPNPVRVAMSFRNTTDISLTATKVDLDSLLRDMMEETDEAAAWKRPSSWPDDRENPEKEWWLFQGLRNLPYMNTDRLFEYIPKTPTVTWSEKVTPADDHHDRRIIINAPISEPGLYWVTCKPAVGTEQYTLLWVDAAVMLRRQFEDGYMYTVNRADNGAPIDGAECSFYGVASRDDAGEPVQLPGNSHLRKGTLIVKKFVKTTDENGVFVVSPDELPENFQWCVTVRNRQDTGDGPLLMLSWENEYPQWFAQQIQRIRNSQAAMEAKRLAAGNSRTEDDGTLAEEAELYRQTNTYMMTDRPVYRPGQTAHYKFWIRTATYGAPDDTGYAGRTFTLLLMNPKGEKAVETQVTTDEYGGAEGEYAIPADAPLGMWNWSILDGDTANYRWSGMLLRVEEYKKPEYEVTVDAPADPVRLGETIEATISAKYYFGSPVTEAKVKYKVTRTATQNEWYPVWRWDWLYGCGTWWFGGDYGWYPGWRTWGRCGPDRGYVPSSYGFSRMPPEVVLEDEVDIGPDGTVKLKIDTAIAAELFPRTDHRYEISAEVVDNSRRTIVGNGAVIASQKPFTVTTWTDRGYYDVGDTAEVQFAARSADGKPVAGKAKVTLYSVDYTASDATPKDPSLTAAGMPAGGGIDPSDDTMSEYGSVTLPVREKIVGTWETETDADGTALQKIVAGAPGQYRVACEVTSARGETVEGGYLFSVFSGTGDAGTVKGVSPMTAAATVEKYRFNGIELLPDRREYAPGDTVQMRVATNQENSFVLLWIRPSNMNVELSLMPQFLRVTGRSVVVPIKVKAADMPNFFVHALTIADGQVHEAVREICVPPVSKVIDVTVKPSKTAYKPGEKATVELELRDPDGKPMTGPVVVTIYDKSVEYISGGSQIPDIKNFFWNWRRYFHNSGYQWTRRDQYRSRTDIYVPISYHPTLPILSPLGGMSMLYPLGGYDEFPMFRDRDFSVNSGSSRRLEWASASGGLNMYDGGRARMGGMGGMSESMRNSMPLSFASAPAASMMAMDSLSSMSDAEPASLSQPNRLGMSGGGETGSGPLVEATVRKSFADTALWVGTLMASNDGTAEVSLDMPENLTTWKIRVWGMTHGTSCGEGTAEIITRKDLILRMQTPRFLVQTDEVVLTANVHNYLATDKEVTVSLELPGTMVDGQLNGERAILEPISEGGATTQRVKIPAQGEAQINWRVRALDEGDAVVRMKALTDEESDAMELTVPCKIHGMLRREAISGIVAPDAQSGVMKFTVPAERRPDQTQLVVNVSPTISASMIDALPYLIEYPYGCTEQTLNRFLPAAVVRKSLVGMGIDLETVREATANLNTQQLGDAKDRAAQNFGSESPDARMRGGWAHRNISPVFETAELNQIINTGVERLVEMQLSDGGWGWFSGWGERASAHTTATAVRGLIIARRSDVAVDDTVLRRGVAWLVRWQKDQIEKLQRGDELRRLREAEDYEAAKKISDYRMAADSFDVLVWMTVAEAVADGLLPDGADETTVETPMATMSTYIFRDRPVLPIYAQAMAGLGFELRGEKDKLAVVLRGLNQYLVQDDENQTAWLDLGPNVHWWCWYGSNFEAQAYYLKLLVRTDPKSETTRRVVKYLLNNRRGGTYWNSTRDTALCVEAMGEFLAASGEMNVSTTVDVKLDGKTVKTIRFTPETLFTTDNVYMIGGADLADGEHMIELVKSGSGPLYFHGYLENFTLQDRIEHAGLEVKIDRVYWKMERVEDATAVAAGGHGQVVSIGIEKYTRKRIEDLSELVSGDLVEVELIVDSKNDYEYLMFIDPKAAGFEPVDLQSGYNGNSLGAYVEFRDDRVCFFVGTLRQGTHAVSYRLRAEIPGQFSALPARAEAMYAPELQGNSDEFKIRITDR